MADRGHRKRKDRPRKRGREKPKAQQEITQEPPPEEPETLYVASLLAAQAAYQLGRRDVYAPGELLRNEAGQPIGCVGLTIPR